MDNLLFQEKIAALHRLLGAEVSDLSTITTVQRQDGLPQDWVDDLPNLDSAQKQTFYDELTGCNYQWAESLRIHLGG